MLCLSPNVQEKLLDLSEPPAPKKRQDTAVFSECVRESFTAMGFPSLWLFPLHPNHRPGVWPWFYNLSSHSHHFTGDKYPHYPCLTQSAVCVCVCVCTHAPACSCSGSFNQFPVSYSWILSSQDLPPLVMKLLLMLRSRLGYVSSLIALSQSILSIYSDLHLLLF